MVLYLIITFYVILLFTTYLNSVRCSFEDSVITLLLASLITLYNVCCRALQLIFYKDSFTVQIKTRDNLYGSITIIYYSMFTNKFRFIL